MMAVPSASEPQPARGSDSACWLRRFLTTVLVGDRRHAWLTFSDDRRCKTDGDQQVADGPHGEGDQPMEPTLLSEVSLVARESNAEKPIRHSKANQGPVDQRVITLNRSEEAEGPCP
jgi:hypothetical protein